LTPILKPSKFPAASLVQNARSAANDKIAVGKIAPKGTLALLMFITPLHLDSAGCVEPLVFPLFKVFFVFVVSFVVKALRTW